MNDVQRAQILHNCIERIRNGETIEACLRDYPDIYDDLAAMLAAGDLARQAQASPAEVRLAQTQARARFEAALKADLPKRPTGSVRGLLAAGVALLLCGGALAAAQFSLPGDALYPLKGLTEQIQLGLNGGDDDLQRMLEKRRQDETRQLLALERQAEVRFSGTVDAVNGDVAIIDGIPIALTDEMPRPQVGDVVQVRGRTDGGRVQAAQVLVIQRPPAPETTPEAATTPAAPTETATPSPTASPSATASPTATPAAARPTATTGQPCQVRPPLGWVRYEVQPGDTLFALATRANTTVERVAAVNCLAQTDLIAVGQRLYLPSSGGGASPTSAPSSEGERTAPPDEQGTRPSERPSPTATRGQNAQPTPTATREQNN